MVLLRRKDEFDLPLEIREFEFSSVVLVQRGSGVGVL